MTGTESKDEKSRETPANEVQVSFIQIFRYGTVLENAAMFAGVFLGILSGGGIAFNLVMLGELSTAYVERTSPPADRYSTFLPILSTFGGGKRLFNATHEANMEALVNDATALAIGSFISVGISLLFTTLAVAVINWSALRQITTIRMLFLKAVLRQDMSWFDTDNEFNLASKMTENLTKLKDGMSEKLAVVSNLLGTALLCLCIALSLGWKLALVCAAVMPFSIAASFALSNYQIKSSAREMESYSQAGKHAEEILKSVKTVVAYGGESKEVERYSRLLQPAEQYGRKRGWYNGLGNGFNWVLTYCLTAIGLVYGARLILQDMYKPDEERVYVIGIVFSVLFNVYMATQSITLSVPHMEVFASARGAAASIFYLLERKPLIDSFDKKGTSPLKVMGEIALENVTFSYPSRPDIKVLNGFSMRIKPGECVALVGSSGCGKSTVLQLLQRLYDPQSGSVKLDGNDLRNLNIRWLRSLLGVVGQEPVLFKGTIFENISIGFPEATLEDVQRVASMAYAHEFVNNLPKGYETVIGERGASLSGGQKQRIAIARSLLREPVVLLLDEATSALDPHSERQVQAALDRASVGRTTIMVSHRMSTIVNANRIICMDKGAILEEGTHEELMKNKGFYYKLVTTDNHGKEKETSLEETEILPEKIDEEQEGTDTEETESSKPRTEEILNDVRKKELRRRVQKQSSLIECQDWMTPRASVSSALSAGYQSFMHNSELDKKEDVEEVVEISGWQILKLNSPEWLYITIGSIAAFTQGACFPVFALLFGYTSAIFVLQDHDELLHLADLYSGLFLVVAAVAGTCMCLQSATFTSAGLKMTTRLRIQYFEALLRQEIGYYDKQSNTVGAICARLSGDTAEVQGATGLRIGLILQGVSSVVLGVLMGFAYNWKLALVSSVFLPLRIKMPDIQLQPKVNEVTMNSSGHKLIIGLTIYILIESILMGCTDVLTYNPVQKLAKPAPLGEDVTLPELEVCPAYNLMVGSIWLEGKMSRQSQIDEREAMETATSVATEAVVSIKTVQSLGVEPIFLDKFQESLDAGCGAVASKSRWRGLVLGMGIYVPFVSYCCANVYAATLVAGGEIEYKVSLLVTEAVMFGAYMLGQTLVYAPSFNTARNCAARIIDLVNKQPAVTTEDGIMEIEDWYASGKFSFNEVEFAYPTRKKQKVLKGIDMQVEAGKTVALVGSSGSGKSTVLQLMQRFYDPDSGSIELDAKNTKSSLTLPQLRQQLGVVQQEPVLFDRTLAENIAYGANNKTLDMNEIVNAARAANIHNFISTLPKGYDTNLGASGAQLSGGQKQRVCIARALIRSPQLLLLDEATSALDTHSERAIAQALDKASEGRTCVIVAHRLTTIRTADMIYVLDKGRIVECGSHEELMEMRGFYYRMCKGQDEA